MSWSSYPIELETYPDPRTYYPPAPVMSGTVCLLCALFLAYSLYSAESTPAAMAQAAAIPVGIGFLVSVFFDSRKGLWNLFRTDLLCIIGIYGLTLAEFLFPQEEFNAMTTAPLTASALNMTLLGIAGLAIGRHLVPPKPMQSRWLQLQEISNNSLFNVYVLSALLGFLYMLMAVNFDPAVLIQGMIGPRFSEPWARNRIGGWSSLLTELGLLRYIIPPLAGVIWNRRRSYAGWQIFVVIAIFALTMFHGFSGGTRNIFVAYLATFIMGYLLTLPKITFRNTVTPILIATLMVFYGSYHMLEFRTIGLRSYIENRVYESGSSRDTLAVDYNLSSMGVEIITWSLVRPVPRVFFPGKPEGLSVSIEEIVGAEGWTVAATYLGESYMMAGWPGVIGMSIFFGAFAAWWNRMAMRQQSDYALVVYALGFFAAGITMRSMFMLTTAILPVIALILFQKYGPIR
jgi:oligosaccharide repeat unit polymerase